MRIKTSIELSLLALGLVSFGSVQAGVTLDHAGPPTYVPTGKGWGEYQANGNGKGKGGPPTSSGSSGPTCINGICYQWGSPVLADTASGHPNIYYIWYGNWQGNTAPKILTDLANQIGNTSSQMNGTTNPAYFMINSKYYQSDSSGSPTANVSGLVNYGGSTDSQITNYAYGTRLKDRDIKSIVTDAISNGLPKDANAVYFVLTSADVRETSGFCSMYCGWHTHSNIAGADIKYAFVGNPDQCPNACEVTQNSVNGNAGADGMASIIAHELEEAVTDPDLNAWYDSSGQENADKCAWNFGTTTSSPPEVLQASNGGYYNIDFGPSSTYSSTKFLIQKNWDISVNGGKCALSLTNP